MELTLTVDEASPAEIRMRLAGALSLKREKGQFTYGYEPAVTGVLTYDRKAGAFTRFEVLALGEWTWDYREGKPKDLLGVALEIQTRPFAAAGNDRHFPGCSMSNYGYKQEREK